MMALTEKVFKGIDDTRSVRAHAERSVALKHLLLSYEELAKVDASIPNLTDATTGRELKDAFEMLETESQLRMLNNYWFTLHGRSSETEAARDERKHKHWLIKAGVVFTGGLILVITGAVIGLANKSGTMPDNAVLTGILKTAGEVLKVIIGSK